MCGLDISVIALQALAMSATSDLAELLRRAGDPSSIDELLRRGLDWLAGIAPYDLACVLELEGDALRVRAARGRLASDRVRAHRLALSEYPAVREALETRRGRAFTEDDHAHGDGDPFDGVLDLAPGHSCMVVPLAAGSELVGALTLDREECRAFPKATVDLVEIYARVLALALRLADDKRALAELGAQQHERAQLLEERVVGREEHGVLVSSASPLARELATRARQVAATSTPVLILGETGTGKERLAHAIHRWSPRRERPFVVVNCAAIPEALIESELFGHTRGAFTGATRDRSGLFRTAHGGTLLLDEIGEMPLKMQPAMLRTLQEKTVRPVGSAKEEPVDVRVIAATNRDLEQMVKDQTFREDLFYRLHVIEVRIPPLRERSEDIPALIDHFLGIFSARHKRERKSVEKDAQRHLCDYHWPGNVRQLEHVLLNAWLMGEGRELGWADFTLPDSQGGGPPKSDHRSRTHKNEEEFRESERQRILKALAACNWNRVQAAKLSGIPRRTFYRRLKEYGLI